MDSTIVNNVKVIAKEHVIALHLLSLFAGEEKLANPTEIRNILNLLDAKKIAYSRSGTIRFLKELSLTGCGRFRVGRRSGKTRFEWSVDAKELAQAVLASPAPAAVTSASLTPGQSTGGPLTLNHQFNLRSDFSVTITLPADLSAIEAQRLQLFIGALPMAGAKTPAA